MDKKTWIDVSLSFLFALVIGLVFLAYLYWVGIPKTSARNLYNDAVLATERGDIEEGQELLEAAYKIWPEPYIRDELVNQP